MTITAKIMTVYYSELTGCTYDTMAEACKAEFRELLVQRMTAETAYPEYTCQDFATMFTTYYPELWMPKMTENQ